MKKALIIGGSSGVGLALAKQLKDTHEVVVTGSKDPCVEGISYTPFHVNANNMDMGRACIQLLRDVGMPSIFIYAAGYAQWGSLHQQLPSAIMRMWNLAAIAPSLFMQQILEEYFPKRRTLDCVFITSTSASVPRSMESVYAGAKAGLAHFGRSVGLDPCVRMLIAAPAGINTKMREGLPQADGEMLEPTWVAVQILEQLEYVQAGNPREVLLLRDPPRVEVVT